LTQDETVRRAYAATVRSRSRFAALQYFGPGSLADEIQSISALERLSTLEALAGRERLDDFRVPEAHWISLDRWFMHGIEH
jgi:hypothetical protein